MERDAGLAFAEALSANKICTDWSFQGKKKSKKNRTRERK